VNEPYSYKSSELASEANKYRASLQSLIMYELHTKLYVRM
jgi:hypothetical protein